MISCEDVCCLLVMLIKLFNHLLNSLDSCINNSYVLLVLSVLKQKTKKKNNGKKQKSLKTHFYRQQL